MIDSIIKPILSQESLDRFIKFEGKVSHFYLDGPGNVTIGIGCLIPNEKAATKLNLYNKNSMQAVNSDTIIHEFKIVKHLLPAKIMFYYASLTNLRLSENDILNLFYFRIIDLKEQLVKNIPEYSDLPEKIQEVLLDMGFNLGINGLINKFPKFLNAIRNKNFILAAEESQRNNIQESRNIWVKNILLGV